MIRSEQVLRHTDERGALIKAWPAAVTGEVYAVELRPGHSRGHHWHHHGGEWFVALRGEAWLVAEDPETGARQVARIGLHRVYVPAGTAHALFCDAPALVLAIAEVHFIEEETEAHPISAPTADERASVP